MLDSLETLGTLLSAGIWIAVGVYKCTHVERMVDVVRAHGIPFPVLAFWASVIVELGGGVMMLLQFQIWLVAILWLGFLLVATPIFHGRVFVNGAIDYPQYVQVAKNISIAGGLLLVLAVDGTVPDFLHSRLDQIETRDAGLHKPVIGSAGND